MSKRAILKLDGSLEEGFRVTLEVGEEGSLHFAEEAGHLLPAPALIQCLEDWQQSYPFSEGTRIKLKNITVRPGAATQAEDCRQKAKKLQRQLKAWLGSGSFHVIDNQLREAVDRDDLIRVVLRCQDRRLHLLPWHTWDFIDRYQAEVAFSLPTRQPDQVGKPLKSRKKVRILAILGDSDGINTKVDRTLLETLPDAEVVFLVEPLRQQINEQLWEQPWDILFFAGHTQTEDCAGRIFINAKDSLTIDDLRFALKRAIAGGLQLAIFNSCDGLGLVYELEQLGIPQLVVMRQPVPDRVAQEFLKHLLTGLVDGQRFYLAVREAREKLQSLEDCYPCASWLPVIFQNPNQPSLSWQDLRHKTDRSFKRQLPFQIAPSKRQKLSVVILTSLVVTGLVMGVRTLGWLEPAELWTYDRMLQVQPKASLDPRILLVTVTDQDVQRFGKPLTDQTVVWLLKTLEKYQPKVVGLDIYRDIPLEPGHTELVDYLRQSKHLIAICKIGIPGKYPSISQPPGLPNSQLGFSDTLMEDSDGKVRRYSFLKHVKEAKCPTESSFGLQAARQYFSGESGKFTNSMQQPISTATIPPLRQQFGGYQQWSRMTQGLDAIDISRWQVLLNYRPSHQVAEEVSLSKILDNPTSQFLQGRIVLIGYTNSTTKDHHPTPVGEMFGVRIHAHVIHQLLNLATDNRAFVSTWSGTWEFGWIAVWSVLGVMIARLVHMRRSFVLIQGVAFSVLLISCCYGFSQLIWIPCVPSGIALVATSLIVRYLPVFIARRNF